MTTTAPGSRVLAVGEDYNGAAGRTVGSGQSVLSQWVDSAAGDMFWTQTTRVPASAAGTNVTLNVTAPTGDIWNMAGVEVLASSPRPRC
ncbi:MAG: hypothetical protein HOV87_32985 [Catenulispora sp.]|nr:hypothetical protein [Catenulispora sp.]